MGIKESRIRARRLPAVVEPTNPTLPEEPINPPQQSNMSNKPEAAGEKS